MLDDIRREMAKEINSNPLSREDLENKYGKDNVWDTVELQEHFEILGFLAPFCIVDRKSDGEKGSVLFQHYPRFFFSFDSAK